MDMLDQALEASHDKTDEQSIEDHSGAHLQDDGGVEHADTTVAVSAAQAGIIDPSVQYQFRAEASHGGAVTYRVVQVQGAQPADETAQVVTTSTFGTQQVAAQAVLASPFSNGTGEGNQTSADNGHGAETRFAYYPATVAAPGSEHHNSQADAIAAAAPGQFYVMMSPQDVIQQGSPRSIAPRNTHFAAVKGVGSGNAETGGGLRTPRDERRRATHNEVERRRRDKINNWIIKLAKVIPECAGDHSKTGQSKGGILSKACDYITELRNANARVPDILKENERLNVDLDLLRQQYEELKNENTILRTTLAQHGISIERASQT